MPQSRQPRKTERNLPFLLGPDNGLNDSAGLGLDTVKSYIVESITYDFVEDGLPRLGSLIDMDDVTVQIAQFGAADGTSGQCPCCQRQYP